MRLTPTKPVAEKLIKGYQHSAETGESAPDAILKFFNPCGAQTWYISEGMPLDDRGEPLSAPLQNWKLADDWHFFGYCDLGIPGCAELGYVLLSQLKEIKGPFGLGIERDLYFSPKPLKELQ